MAATLGIAYVVYGGAWMLQSTPRVGFADTPQTTPVMQSKAYSCVAASCATMLILHDIPATESEMAELTYTRPRSGSTILRAVAGLNEKLAPTNREAVVINPTLAELRRLTFPAMTAIRAELSQLHMVTILASDEMGVRVADPVYGIVLWDWEYYESIATGQVVIVVPR